MPDRELADQALQERNYKHWYNRGWNYSERGADPTLEHLDRHGMPNAAYDGYADSAAGREKWHLATCVGCEEHPGERAPKLSKAPKTKSSAPPVYATQADKEAGRPLRHGGGQ